MKQTGGSFGVAQWQLQAINFYKLIVVMQKRDI